MSAQPAGEIVPELREALLTQFTTHLYKVRGHDEVVRVLNSPFAKNGMTASLHLALGLSLFELKQYSAAAQEMRECLAKKSQPALTPVNVDIFSAAPWHCLALCLVRTGDLPAAEGAFQSAIAATGRNEAARLDFARLLQQANRPIEALHQLNDVVGRSPTNANAWRLGGEIALGGAEFLSFARDWTGEALAALPDDLVIAVQRAEALLLNGDIAPAGELWEKIWRREHSPRSLAALILCETIESQTTHAPDDSEERTTSLALLEWYQKLIAMRAGGVTTKLNEQLEKISRALPTAARMLEAALNEAEIPTVV
jgi:tetratricopeptide (TPR) repeat protein